MKQCVLPTARFHSPMLFAVSWAYDAVWADIAPRVDAPSRDRVASIVLNAIMDLVAAGERDPIRLWQGAEARAQSALG